MNEDYFEIDTGSCVGLQGAKQNPFLKDEGKLAAQEKPETSGEDQVNVHSRHEQTVAYYIRQRKKLPSSTVATW